MLVISSELDDVRSDREKVSFILEDGIIVGFIPYLERPPKPWSGEPTYKYRPRLLWEEQ